VKQDSEARLGPQDHPEPRDRRARTDFRDNRALEDHKDSKGRVDNLVRPANRDQLDHPDQEVQLDSRDWLGIEERREPPAHPDLREYQASGEHLDWLVNAVFQDPPAHSVQSVPVENLVAGDPVVNQDCKVLLDARVRLD